MPVSWILAGILPTQLTITPAGGGAGSDEDNIYPCLSVLEL